MSPPGPKDFVYLIASVCLIVIIVVILAGVLVTMARKRAHGSTWFPEGFSLRGAAAAAATGIGIGAKPKTNRRTPDVQELK